MESWRPFAVGLLNRHLSDEEREAIMGIFGDEFPTLFDDKWRVELGFTVQALTSEGALAAAKEALVPVTAVIKDKMASPWKIERPIEKEEGEK